MKTSTIIFNVAAVLTLLGVFIALADLARHKTVSYGVTSSPATTAPVAVTASPAAKLE